MGLEDLRKFNAAPPVIERSPLPDLPEGVDWIMGFDPSLKNTGVVVLTRNEVTARTLRPKEHPRVTGSDLLIEQAFDLTWNLTTLIEDLSFDGLEGPGSIAYEKPPVGGGSLRSTESALMAALTLRLFLGRDPGWLSHQPVTSISAQTAKRVICGNANAKKAEVHAVLKARWEVPEVVTNEAERDALMIVITHLKEREQ